MNTLKKKVQNSAGKHVETLTLGECEVDIYLKSQPSGFKHHAFTAPVKVRFGQSGKKIITKTYSAQDKQPVMDALAAASDRCQQLDAILFGMNTDKSV